MAGSLEHFIAFGTDIVGIERIFRLLQAILLVLTSYPPLLSLAITTWAPSPSPPPSVAGLATSLVQLQSQLNLTRRAIRLFWFLGSLRSSWALLGRADDRGAETWLGALAHSSHGLFGLVESATLLDLAGVGGLALLGADEAVRLDRDAQVLWLVALYASALAAAAQVLRLLATRAVPPTADGFGAALAEKKPPLVTRDAKTGEMGGEAAADGEDRGDAQAVRTRERARGKRDAGGSSAGEIRAVVAKLVADVLDTVIPAAKLDWLEIDDGLVGVAMVCSTLLTGKLVWNKCRPRS